MRILVVYPEIPFPANSGAEIRLLALIRGLSQAHEIDLIALSDEADPSHRMIPLKGYFGKIYVILKSKQSLLKQLLPSVIRLFRGIPFYTKYGESRELNHQLRQITEHVRYDAVIIEKTFMAPHVRGLCSNQGTVSVLTMHNVDSLLYERVFYSEKRLFHQLKLLLTLVPLRRWETKIASCFDLVVTVSEADRKILLAHDPNLAVRVVENGVDTDANRLIGRGGRQKKIIFVGALGYPPNVDAVWHLHDEIMPLLHQNHPDCELLVVGKTPPASITKLDGRRGITLKANVETVKPYYQQALVSVVPLTSGGGTRLKILESMALGTPVVSTRIGCEGLDVVQGHHLLIADDMKEIVQYVEKLLTDPVLWTHLAENGRKLVEDRYNWNTISCNYMKMLVELSQKKTPKRV